MQTDRAQRPRPARPVRVRAGGLRSLFKNVKERVFADRCFANRSRKLGQRVANLFQIVDSAIDLFDFRIDSLLHLCGAYSGIYSQREKLANFPQRKPQLFGPLDELDPAYDFGFEQPVTGLLSFGLVEKSFSFIKADCFDANARELCDVSDSR